MNSLGSYKTLLEQYQGVLVTISAMDAVDITLVFFKYATHLADMKKHPEPNRQEHIIFNLCAGSN